MNLFSGKTTDSVANPTGLKSDGNKVGTGGLETRCSNPDNGYPFEMS